MCMSIKRLLSLMCDTGKQKIPIYVCVFSSICIFAFVLLPVSQGFERWGFWGCFSPFMVLHICSLGWYKQFRVLCPVLCLSETWPEFLQSKSNPQILQKQSRTGPTVLTFTHKLPLFKCVCGLSFKTDKNIHTILDCFGILKLRKF